MSCPCLGFVLFLYVSLVCGATVTCDSVSCANSSASWGLEESSNAHIASEADAEGDDEASLLQTRSGKIEFKTNQKDPVPDTPSSPVQAYTTRLDDGDPEKDGARILKSGQVSAESTDLASTAVAGTPAMQEYTSMLAAAPAPPPVAIATSAEPAANLVFQTAAVVPGAPSLHDIVERQYQVWDVTQGSVVPLKNPYVAYIQTWTHDHLSYSSVDWSTQIVYSCMSCLIYVILGLLVWSCCYPGLPTKSASLQDLEAPETILQDGHFQCHRSPEICLCALVCPGIRWADTMALMGLLKISVGMSAYFFCGLMNGFVYTSVVYGPFTLMLVVYYRQKLRQKFGLDYATRGTCAIDCLYLLFCPWCAIAQEARVVTQHLQTGRSLVEGPSLGGVIERAAFTPGAAADDAISAEAAAGR